MFAQQSKAGVRRQVDQWTAGSCRAEQLPGTRPLEESASQRSLESRPLCTPALGGLPVSHLLPTQQPAQPFAKANLIASPLRTNAGSPLSRVSVWSAPTHYPEARLQLLPPGSPPPDSSQAQAPRSAWCRCHPQGCAFPLGSACCIHGAQDRRSSCACDITALKSNAQPRPAPAHVVPFT